MDILALALFVVLTIIAAMHFYWAFGGLRPGKDEATLAKTVVGAKGLTRMPPRWLSALVAVLIFTAAIWPLMWRALTPYFIPQGMVWLGMIVLIIVFLGRGIAGYLPFFQRSNCEQPFARLNAVYFSPLCLLIGCGFVVLLFGN